MYSEEDCIESLRKADEMVDGKLSRSKYESTPLSPSGGYISRKFGTWNEAKQAAGLNTIDQGDNGYDYVPCYECEGYLRWEHNHNGERDYVNVHRLHAVLKFGFDAITKDKDIHHKNGRKFDNRLENYELLDHDEHSRLHNQQRVAQSGD